ncbi:hypothetical protein VNO77_04950 [Canavalia gladiata]|uniref:TF-B3 domain-containing protein n=1 Tax=Canavalia gladiata TaxID=3824 RepID=A0AAN9R876_CANGL
MPTTTTVSSSSNQSLVQAQQNMGHPQNVHFPDYSAPPCFPEPYFVPYDRNLRFPHMDTFPQVNEPLGYPLYSLPMGESSVLYRMPNSELQGWSQPREEERNMSRVARDRRKQARQRNRSSSALGAPIVPIGTIKGQQPVTSGGSNVKVTVNQNRNPHVFCTPDGKRIEEILTKELKNSDVGCLGRIVLPKREAEMKLPALWDKEGIDVVLKDVYSELRWNLKYKYWSNNKSRMYVLENAGDFVNHYELQNGDSITLYEDEFKNLYVSTKKERNPEVSETPSSTERLQYIHTPYTHQAKDEEEEAYLALLIKELNHKREAEATNSLLTLCNDEGSTSGTEYNKMAQDLLPNNSTTQTSSQTTIEAARSSSEGDTVFINDDHQHNNFDDVYGFTGNKGRVKHRGSR